MMHHIIHFNPIVLRTAKIPQNFGRSKCNRVKGVIWKIIPFIPASTGYYPRIVFAVGCWEVLLDVRIKYDEIVPRRTN